MRKEHNRPHKLSTRLIKLTRVLSKLFSFFDEAHDNTQPIACKRDSVSEFLSQNSDNRTGVGLKANILRLMRINEKGRVLIVNVI